ncbi:MAG: hypothetical protein ACRCWG_04810 [Sarcina sp.]
MGYTIFEVSEEINVNSSLIYKEIENGALEDCTYEKNGVVYIKEVGIQKILDVIDSKKIELEYIAEYEREIMLLKIEVLQSKKEVEIFKKEIDVKDKYIKTLEDKISEMNIIEKRLVNTEEKVIEHMRASLVTRSERNKKRKWF